MPVITEHIDMWNLWGEKFSGLVTVIDWDGECFKIQEHGTNADIWVELDRLNYWDYCKSQDPVRGAPNSTRTPSPRARRAREDIQE